MSQRVLYLVRHAQSDRAEASADRFGPGLTELGRRQADLTAERLSELPISAIHHSPLRRAAETAEILAARFPGVPLRASALLRECIPYLPASFKDWYTRLTPDEIQAYNPLDDPANSIWLQLCPPQAPWEEISAGENQAKRAYQKFARAARGERGDRLEIVVCHGNLLRYFVCQALGAPPESWVNTDIRNCGISEILVRSNGETMLVSHNDTGHLPEAVKTYI